MSSRSVLLGLFLLGVVAVGAFAFLYFRVLYYERRAVEHIPSSAKFAARVDLEQLVLFAPVREHIVPVLLQNSEKSAEGQRLKELEASTGINLGMDLREVVFLSSGGSDHGIIIGGLFPASGVVQGLHDLVRGRGSEACSLAGERLSCTAPPVHVETTSEGLLVAATSETLLAEMRPTGEHYRTLGLLREGPGSFGMLVGNGTFGGGALLRRWSLFGEMSKLRRIEGRLELDERVRLIAEGVPNSGFDLSSWKPGLEQLRDLLQLAQRFAPGLDYAGERALLDRTRFSETEGGRVRAEAEWQEEEIAQAARSLAAVLEAWFSGR